MRSVTYPAVVHIPHTGPVPRTPSITYLKLAPYTHGAGTVCEKGVYYHFCHYNRFLFHRLLPRFVRGEIRIHPNTGRVEYVFEYRGGEVTRLLDVVELKDMGTRSDDDILYHHSPWRGKQIRIHVNTGRLEICLNPGVEKPHEERLKVLRRGIRI